MAKNFFRARHLTESHVTLSCPSLLSALLFFSFSILCLWFRYHRDSFRHSKFLPLYTFANSGDPARFLLFPISLFPRSTLLRISRDPLIFVFIFELNIRALLFLISRSFFIFLRPFFFLLVFGFGFVIFFALSQFLSILFHFFPSLDIFSRIFHESTLFSFPFIFFLSFASFRIFRIRFSARAFYVSRSFSRIIPVFFSPFLYFVLFSLFPLHTAATFFNSSFSLFHYFAVLDYFDRS